MHGWIHLEMFCFQNSFVHSLVVADFNIGCPLDLSYLAAVLPNITYNKVSLKCLSAPLREVIRDDLKTM